MALKVDPVPQTLSSDSVSHRWFEQVRRMLNDIYLDGGLYPMNTITATAVTLTDAYHYVYCNCTSNVITVNLPAVSTVARRLFVIKKIDSTGNAVTIDGSGAETIDGATTKTISSQYSVTAIQAGATEWHIVN